MHRQFINSCLSYSTCFFATNSSQFVNFLAISSMIFLEEPLSQCQFSIQADFVSLSLICPSTCLVKLNSLRFKFLIDLMKSDVRIFLLPISCLTFSLSVKQFLLSLSVPRTAESTLRSRIFWIFPSVSANAQRFDLDLSSLLNVN